MLQMTHLVRLIIISTSKWSNFWKRGLIKLAFTNGKSPTDISNYHLICILPAMSKMVEKYSIISRFNILIKLGHALS